MSLEMTRRNFVAGTLVAGASATAINNLANAAESDTDNAFENSITWDAEYDVVVIGYGFAGATTAITAADDGARVLIVEKCNPQRCRWQQSFCHAGLSLI